MQINIIFICLKSTSYRGLNTLSARYSAGDDKTQKRKIGVIISFLKKILQLEDNSYFSQLGANDDQRIVPRSDSFLFATRNKKETGTAA